MGTELVRKIRGTRILLGKTMKSLWVEAKHEDCEPLMLGDLIRGDKFIVMPTPGDNSGHGGLLSGSYLFLATEKIGHSKFVTNCIRLCDGTPLLIKDEVFVLKVE